MGWDDIVVGLGLVGASVARRLAESGRRVLRTTALVPSTGWTGRIC
jgi:choline dehydrogenase-like flavoprotein